MNNDSNVDDCAAKGSLSKFCGQPKDASVHKVTKSRYVLAADSADPMHVYQPEPTEPPARVWHSGSLQIATQAGSWFDRKDLTLAQRELRVADTVSDFAESVVNAHLEPIRAALDKCENIGQPNKDVVVFERVVWDALVKSVKGEK